MTEDFLLHIEDGDLYIQIPIDVYKQLNINEGDELSLGIEGERMFLSKVRPSKNSS
jgi:antitoxin component of MazEF toxin-antitoxin module